MHTPPWRRVWVAAAGEELQAGEAQQWYGVTGSNTTADMFERLRGRGGEGCFDQRRGNAAGWRDGTEVSS